MESIARRLPGRLLYNLWTTNDAAYAFGLAWRNRQFLDPAIDQARTGPD